MPFKGVFPAVTCLSACTTPGIIRAALYLSGVSAANHPSIILLLKHLPGSVKSDKMEGFYVL